MDFQSLRLKAADSLVFRYRDVLKWFSKDNEGTIKQNLKFWIKKGWLERIIKGVYKFKEKEIKEEFFLSSFFDQNSYISLESALSFYGMIPEYPYAITAVTTNKTKKLKTKYGVFLYRKIKTDLFFGFKTLSYDNFSYRIATLEKALFDFIYFNQRQIKDSSYFEEMRLNFPKDFLWKKFLSWLSLIKNKNLIFYLKNYAYQ
jgi:predicted transcriptional regulator of viral defense system